MSRPFRRSFILFIAVGALLSAFHPPSWRLRVEIDGTVPAGGPGGQHQNKTESGVRYTHLPTGIAAVASGQ